jgi:ElaB/YqjD/DUF883 family membrane-anchored ribosome-binding protein
MESIMLESNIKVVNKDMKNLVKDAQALFNAAAALSGDKAGEMHEQGMRLLDTALTNAQEAQASTLVFGKEMAHSANGYVKDNPWSTIAAAAGVGLAVGVLLGHGHGEK